jgi:hypothetical protein
MEPSGSRLFAYRREDLRVGDVRGRFSSPYSWVEDLPQELDADVYGQTDEDRQVGKSNA